LQHLPLRSVNAIVGPNGCGKSNLYQSMVLLCASARGQPA
jgi:predicted ATPase